MGTSRRHQRGFTLIEMMVVVGLIAILAAVVVPSFFREGRKTKAISEVTPMFAELHTKLMAYKSDNGSFLGGTLGLVDAVSIQCPPTITSAAQDAQATCGADLAALRFAPPQATIKCQYTLTAGIGSGTPLAVPTGFTFSQPTMATNEWYTILAECDGDGVNTAAKNSYYFTSSVDPTTQKYNEGY